MFYWKEFRFVCVSNILSHTLVLVCVCVCVYNKVLTKPSLCRTDIFVFLLSTRAGGLGINLTAADTVSPPRTWPT